MPLYFGGEGTGFLEKACFEECKQDYATLQEADSICMMDTFGIMSRKETFFEHPDL